MGKIYVSNYSCRKKEILENALKVQISMSKPDGFAVHVNWKRVAPQWNGLLGPHKRGEIDDEEYTRRYERDYLYRYRDEIVNEMNWLVRKAAGHDIVLFCWCGQDKFCHRFILQRFLNENGFVVERL